ncbi:MFS transporter [Phocicoccus pinnipedialis]|uniref:Tetracycline resistance protein, class C n=1 Tax=Phocicoccus pinnipedialis TaxID=110845 RepID=A0A6V7QZS8_9BACL|nr:MFS transporter [Jeotgalicoccus pinnipedialis]MBP1938722.1 MFS family permease [Jeotgalicoccus pinnipedialis]CAD2070530.1 Tetracycline resistance protein, class C [Jeotgalicoccus pinnipedialis]
MKGLIYFIIVICFLDLFVQLPVVTPFAMSLGADEFTASIVVATYSVTNLLGNIIGGYLSDKVGRKKTLLFGMFLQVIIISIYVSTPSIPVLIGIRAIHGFTSGTLTPAAFSLVQDISRRQAIGKSMAFTGVAIGTAAVVGPAMGGIISSKASYETLYMVLAGIYVVGFLLTAYGTKESSTVESRKSSSETSWITLLKRRTLNVSYLSSLALMTSMGALSFALPLKTIELGLDDHVTGALLSVFGITAVIIFGTPLNRMYTDVSALKLIEIGILVITISMICIHFATSLSFMYLTLALYGCGYALVFPSMNKIIGQFANMSERGKANGIFYSYFSLGSVVGSTLAGYFTTLFGLPFLSMAIVMIVLFLILFILGRNINFKEV